VDTVEIISAYRRKELNEALLKEGHQVSPGSLHMKGQAVDFHMDEIREETLRDYLTGLGLGGVGYYGPLDFIHVDTGPVRSWGGSEPFAQKLIGIVQADSPVQLTSDKNDYLPDEKLYFTWQFKKGYRAKKISDIELEHFWRGKWIPCPGQATPENQSILPTSSLFCPSESEKTGYGKYRWIFRVKGEAQPLSSNEFYLKKE
jgi:hypothetical protein